MLVCIGSRIAIYHKAQTVSVWDVIIGNTQVAAFGAIYLDLLLFCIGVSPVLGIRAVVADPVITSITLGIDEVGIVFTRVFARAFWLAATALTGFRLLAVIGTFVLAIRRAVTVAICVRSAATTDPRLRFIRISGTLVIVIRAKVAALGTVCLDFLFFDIGVTPGLRIGAIVAHPILANITLGIDEVRIVLTGVVAGTFWLATTALARRRLLAVIGTAVVTIGSTVTVAICVRSAATAYARIGFVRIVRTTVLAVTQFAALLAVRCYLFFLGGGVTVALLGQATIVANPIGATVSLRVDEPGIVFAIRVRVVTEHTKY